MTTELKKFLNELAIGGIKYDNDLLAEQEFCLELDMRPHILKKKLSWDDITKSLIIQVEIESLNESSAANQMAEEMFEVANALLNYVEGLNVKVVSSKQLALREEFTKIERRTNWKPSLSAFPCEQTGLANLSPPTAGSHIQLHSARQDGVPGGGGGGAPDERPMML